MRLFESTRQKREPIAKFWKNVAAVALGAPKAPLYACIWTTAPESSNTRIIARCDREWERYFAYAIA